MNWHIVPHTAMVYKNLNKINADVLLTFILFYTVLIRSDCILPNYSVYLPHFTLVTLLINHSHVSLLVKSDSQFLQSVILYLCQYNLIHYEPFASLWKRGYTYALLTLGNFSLSCPSPSEFPTTFRGGGMDTFWNYTMYILSLSLVELRGKCWGKWKRN